MTSFFSQRVVLLQHHLLPATSLCGYQHYDEHLHTRDFRSHLAHQQLDSVKDIEDDPCRGRHPRTHDKTLCAL
jgi:hypothetical protein